MTIGLLPTSTEQPQSGVGQSKWYWSKRFSFPRPNTERHLTTRPYESFRSRKDTDNPQISYGFASLNAEEKCDEGHPGTASRSWTSSVFSIYGGCPGPFKICEQAVGAQADVFIASLGEKNLHLLQKFLENSQRQENQCFMWIKDRTADKFTVISVKTLENHLRSSRRVRRVKWRQRPSSDMTSVYRYSIPSISYWKSKRACHWILQQKNFCIFLMWSTFILLFCVIIVLGALSPDNRTHHYLNDSNNFTEINLLALRNISIG